jgi:hypothetical protein
MIPIPGLESVKCAWIDIQAHGFSLHGFLLFLASDHFFPEYLDGEGLGDLDVWSGDDCAIFVVQSPSAAWIEYTKATGHSWWKLFGHLIDQDSYVGEFLSTHGNAAVLEIDGKARTLREVFAPCLNQFQHSKEIAKVLHRFNLQPTDHPSLILFRDISDREVWHIDLRDLVDIPQRDLRAALQTWFSGNDFKQLLKEASDAKN